MSPGRVGCEIIPAFPSGYPWIRDRAELVNGEVGMVGLEWIESAGKVRHQAPEDLEIGRGCKKNKDRLTSKASRKAFGDFVYLTNLHGRLLSFWFLEGEVLREEAAKQ
jgi:hypothetical protein